MAYTWYFNGGTQLTSNRLNWDRDTPLSGIHQASNPFTPGDGDTLDTCGRDLVLDIDIPVSIGLLDGMPI